MLFVVEADSVRSGNSKKDPTKRWTLQKMLAYALDKASGQPAKWPTEFSRFLDSPADALPPGTYRLAPDAVYLNREGKLAVAPRFAPVPVAK